MNPRRWGGGLLVALVLLPAVLATPSPGADVDSSEPLGLSRMADHAREADREIHTVFASPAALRTETDAALVVLPGVPRPLAEGEVRALEDRLDAEGHVWALDETGGAARLSQQAGIRVLPDPLLDPSSPFGDPKFVEARARLGNATYELLLTAPTLLEVDENRSRVVARARDAVRDVDRSGAVEPSDPSGDPPVVAAGTVDGRRLVVAADTGLFTNTVLQEPEHDNAAFLADLMAAAPEGPLALDVSRHDPSRALAPAKVATQGLLWVSTHRLALGLVVAGLAGAASVAARSAPAREAWGRHEHELGRRRGLDPGARRERLRRALVRVVSENGDRDPSELLGLSDEELEAEAERVLGTGEYLKGGRDMSERFRTVRRLLASGGSNPWQ